MRYYYTYLLAAILCFCVLNVFLRYRVKRRQKTRLNALHYRYSQHEFPIVIYYEYNPNRSTNLGNEYNIIQAAINNINETTQFTFFTMLMPGLKPTNINSVLHLKDSTGKHECIEPFDGPYGILAHSYYPPHKKICIDASEEWSSEKLCNTLIHELCHSLGLGHDNSSKYRTIMNAHYSNDVWGLQPADVKKLQKIYPFIHHRQ